MSANPPWTEQRRSFFHKECANCGAEFVAQVKWAVYCSPRCRGAMQNRTHYRRYREQVRAVQAAYRAKKKAAT